MNDIMFWTGIAVFAIGIALRYYFKFKWYRAYNASMHTPYQLEQMKTQYRLRIFLGIGVQIAGLLMSCVSFW